MPVLFKVALVVVNVPPTFKMPLPELVKVPNPSMAVAAVMVPVLVTEPVQVNNVGAVMTKPFTRVPDVTTNVVAWKLVPSVADDAGANVAFQVVVHNPDHEPATVGVAPVKLMDPVDEVILYEVLRSPVVAVSVGSVVVVRATVP